MVSIGLVGCGRWGRLILRDLLSLGADVTVAATGEGALFAKQAGCKVVSEPADLPDVSGIVVATPLTTHADVIEALLLRGVPIYCEKPLCDDAARARRLAAAAPQRLFVMDKWRYHAGVRELAGIARSGELGPISGLRTTRIGYGHSHSDTDCVWTLLPHDLSIAIEILGGLLAPVSCVADLASGEVMGLIASSVTGGRWHVAEIGIRSPVEQRSVTLFCRDGVAMLADSYADHISIIANPPSDGQKPSAPQVTRRPIGTGMPLLAELTAFIDHLNGGPSPKSSAAEAADTVAMIAELRSLARI